MDDATSSTRYWCHLCDQLVDPVIEGEIIKCNFCQSGFVEVMDNSEDPDNSDHLHQTADSLWAPILLGLMDDQDQNTRNQNQSASEPVVEDENDGDADGNGDDDDENNDGEVDLDQQLESIMRRRRRHSAAILDLLQGIRAGISVESQSNSENSESELVVLINTFNERMRVEESMDTSSVPPESLSDYFIGPGFEMLLERLAENDLNNRYGTPPATKDAIESLKVVEIEESLLQCTVCLDDFEIGMEAKEMPCKHKFHNGCLLPWLEIHSSCPVCRYLLPKTGDDDEPKTDTEMSRNDDNNDDIMSNGSPLESSTSAN